jgi:putative hydrolase of the HAD superfamily
MKKMISSDLDGTLIKSTYADLVWLVGLPKIYAEEKGISIEQAKQFLIKEYDKIGDDQVQWYDISYWFERFHLQYHWKNLLADYKGAIEPYAEARNIIQQLSKEYTLIILSNAKQEFINIELQESELQPYFTQVFSSISDFHQVKKVGEFYKMICRKIGIHSSELIHVGDHYIYDYSIPKSIGITAFYLDREKKQTGEDVVFDLNEFKEKISI